MKILITTYLISLALFYTVTAQPVPGSIINNKLKQSESDLKFYPIPGSHLLDQEWQKTEPQLKAYIKTRADKGAVQNLKKTSAWSFTAGQAHNWWATNQNPSDPDNNTEYQVASHCRAVGNNCYIFVEDLLWANAAVDQAAVESILTAFEIRTPADPSNGIFQLDTMYFGDPPDADTDPRIIILILDIKDGFAGTGGYIAGYFYKINEYSDADVQAVLGSSRHSNNAEIYYVDANPAKLKTSSGINSAASTTAHEFQHMIHWNYDDKEIAFINEGMSESASMLCGYDMRSPSLYYANTNVNFLSWDISGNVLQDYSRAALFSWYLIEQFGSSLTKQIVHSPLVGIDGYNDAFQNLGSTLRFEDMIKNFTLASVINDKNIDPKYGFTVSIPIKPTAITYYSPNVSMIADTVKPYGTRYVEFSGGQSLSVNVNGSGSLEVMAIAAGTSGTRADNVTVGSTYSLTDFGTNYSTATLAVINPTNTETIFTYSASGYVGTVLELKYDLTEPNDYLIEAAGDTVCVWFSGVPGGRLDSVRVALQRAGTMTGGIWTYTGNARPSPLGTPLAAPVTAAVALTPGVPYPVPWPNWGTIDLRANNIDASNAFAVAFIDEGDHTTEPRVMVTESPIPDEITSLTYSTTSSAGPNWYYFSSNAAGDSVYTYLIRAYVSSYTTGVKQNTELTPASFTLEQNFPNPFNPSTTIRFQMPSKGLVTLKVYDIIGREVITLVNGFKETGMHEVKFNASGLPSGVYLYRITSGTFTQTRKLVFIK